MGIDFGTAESTPRWHSGPNERGTFQLLTECVITMALCVYTAVHLNVPEFNNPGKHARIRTGWILLGLFAPELVTWTAYEQRREAMMLHRRMKRALGEDVPPPFLEKIRLWVRRKEAKKGPDEEAGGEREKIGPEVSARKHAWTTLHISTAYINDKSKADWLAKALVILQASWFVVQCAARVAGGLSLSLIELNTWSHAVCALLAYALWWNKPLNVEEPALIRGDGLDMMCAGMAMRSPMGTLMEADDFIVREKMVARLWFEKHGCLDLETPEYGMMENWITRTRQEEQPGSTSSSSSGSESERGPPHQTPIYVAVDPPCEPPSPSSPFRLYMGQSIYGFGFRRGR
ncbi:hypothetical protein OQA88_7182 [Cercophora sp. LCS_1]